MDRYGRSLRYVDVDGVDAGLRLITQGYAVARYDSRDGYGRHAREAAYVRADARSPRAACSTPQDNPRPAPAPTSPSTTPRSTTPRSTTPRNTTPPLTSPTRPTSGWPLDGDRHPCPQARPVKGNEPSMIAHRPGQQSYLVTNPEQCFGSLAEAASAGFRPARR